MATKTCHIDYDDMILDDTSNAAVLFEIDGEEVWIPRSILYGYEDGKVEVAEWWAIEHELV